jgi:hypothetical protein
MTMNPRRKEAAGQARQAVADVSGQLAALREMTVGQLCERYREVFGEPTRSRNKDRLRKKIAWRIQELAEGGLSNHAQARIAELAPNAPVRWRSSSGGGPGHHAPRPDQAKDRDPCLPPPSTVLIREHQGAEHRVTVLEDGFEYRGARYRSLSKIAQEITGTRWNGYLFFRLKSRAKERGAGGEA